MEPIVQFVDQLRVWLSTSLLGVIAFVVIKGMALMLKNQIENRNTTIEERKQEREGYGPLITTLREEIDRITAREHACEERMNRLEGELAGYHRQLLTQSIHGVAHLPASQMVVDAAERVHAILSDEQE